MNVVLFRIRSSCSSTTALEAIRKEVWKPGQTLPKLRHAIALILQELKCGRSGVSEPLGKMNAQ